MSELRVDELWIYPVKSSAPLSLSRAWVDDKGLNDDRRYLVIDPSGHFMTARQYPRLTLLDATPVQGGLVLAASGLSSLSLSIADFPQEYHEVVIWGQDVRAQSCGPQAAEWMTEFLGVECQLVFFGADTRRPVKAQPGAEVSFADGYPLLLTHTASLEALNAGLEESVQMLQFRPNLVVKGLEAFAEESWLDLKIGDCYLRVHSPCERCKLITLQPGQTQFHPQQQPLKYLSQHHRLQEGGAIFGQNLSVIKPGLIMRGMPVEILSYQTPAPLR